jgi:hypothetical protein
VIARRKEASPKRMSFDKHSLLIDVPSVQRKHSDWTMCGQDDGLYAGGIKGIAKGGTEFVPIMQNKTDRKQAASVGC